MAATCSKMVSRLVSVTRYSSSGNSASPAMRLARILICRSDSSPETYNTRSRFAIASAICSISVDLPMPGSPPTSTIEPGTSPPPSTRANSPIGTWMRSSLWLLTSDRRRGVERPLSPRAAVLAPPPGSATTSSTMLLKDPHCGHFPMNPAETRPHCWQTKRVWVFVLGMYLL